MVNFYRGKMSLRLVLASLMMLSVADTAAAENGCFKGASHFSAEDWSFCQQIQPDLFMYYTPFPNEGNLMLGLHAAKDTFGWTALAVAGNGGMKGASQIVVRQSEDDEWVAEDRNSQAYAMPALDVSQDIKLLFAAQTDAGETSWGVLLPMKSCDEFDYPIQNISVFMHWAFGSDHTFGYHLERGQYHANLLQAPQELPSTEGLDYTDILMPSVNVVLGEGGTDPTNPYICSFFDIQELVPDVDPESKTHITRLAPVLDEASEQYVHHMILYSCEGGGGLGDDDGDDDREPVEFEHLKIIPECESMPSGCSIMKWPWAVGSEEIVLPDDVGLPFGEGQRWLVLQTHYYNPNLDANINDSSGVRAYYTQELRPQDAGVMELDGGTGSFQRNTLPAGESSIALNAFVVPSSCTVNAWDSELNILGVVHHMHLSGVEMDIDVEREGRNLGPLRLEHHYDFNHQSLEGSALMTLLPGDQLAMHCRYDTSRLSEGVSFGDLTQQEMCFAAVMYYPRQKYESFGYLPAPFDKTLCLTAGSEESAELSQCAQFYAENVPAFYGFEDGVEIPFGALVMCNSDWYVTDILPYIPNSCPDCYMSKNCTAEDVVSHGQLQLCPSVCSSAGVSLYPNLTMTEGYDQGTYGCPTTENADGEGSFIYFQRPELAPLAACEMVGNLSQVIELQPPTEAGDTGGEDIDVEGGEAAGATSAAIATYATTVLRELLLVISLMGTMMN